LAWRTKVTNLTHEFSLCLAIFHQLVNSPYLEQIRLHAPTRVADNITSEKGPLSTLSAVAVFTIGHGPDHLPYFSRPSPLRKYGENNPEYFHRGTWPSTFHAVQHYFLVVPTSPLGLIDSERCRRQASFSRHTASIRLLVAAPSKTSLFACCFSLLALVPPPAALPRVSCRLRPDYCRFGLSRTFLYSPTILQAVSLC
jgi:hypothetical protein